MPCGSTAGPGCPRAGSMSAPPRAPCPAAPERRREHSFRGAFYRGLVTGRDDSERPGPDFPPWSSGSSAGDDVVEIGSRRPSILRSRAPPIAVILAAAALVGGLAVGYAAGNQQGRKSAAPLSRSSAAAPPPSAASAVTLSQSGRQCSAQIGHALPHKLTAIVTITQRRWPRPRRGGPGGAGSARPRP